MSAQHTPGPWGWYSNGDRPYLATPDRGRLYVMGFERRGMQGAGPRFAHWPGMQGGMERGRRGGIMESGPYLQDGSLHPDARLIAAAPELLAGVCHAESWIGDMPHGENCFLSDCYDGDPGNQCNCGKESLLASLREVIAKAVQP